jgi:hypothetical protein
MKGTILYPTRQYSPLLCLIICLFWGSSFALQAQCAMVELSLSERVAQAAYVFEGKVIAQTAFWNDEHTHIYTANYIQTHKDFTQNTPPYLTLLTQGGTVGDISEVVSPNLYLQIGDKGLFLATASTVLLPDAAQQILQQNYKLPQASLALQSYGGAQGFVRYNDSDNTAIDLSSHYFDIEQEIYAIVAAQKGSNYRTLHHEKPAAPSNLAQQQQLLVPSITNISPTVLRGGTNDTITVTGTGFGTLTGLAALQFRNPDYYGLSVSYQSVAASNIISWTNTQIRAIVPGRDIGNGNAGAGSGNVRVRDNSGVIATSTQAITVLYNRHVHNTFTRVDLSNDNGTGGYTFTYNTAFNGNTAAKNAFLRAHQTWICAAMSNFSFATATTTVSCAANDNINLISFDNNCLLPTGTLAQTSQWYASCTNGDKYFIEMDIIFSSATVWNYATSTTGTTQKNFESIALHELGHAQAMGHVLDYGKIMYPSLANGVDLRSVDADALTCVQSVVERSRQSNGCGTGTYIPVTTCGVKAKATLFLQGAYNSTSGEMNTTLSAVLPSAQPFNQAPWNYSGTETASPMPADVVDWVLLEARTTPNGTATARKPALLRKDGSIIGTDGTLGINFTGLTAYNSYYVVVRHRNHLAVMSQNALVLPNAQTLDLSKSSNIRGTNQSVALTVGKNALYAGDANANGIINVADFNVFAAQNGSVNQYLRSDFDLNKNITINDFNTLRPNSAIIGISEIRY